MCIDKRAVLIWSWCELEWEGSGNGQRFAEGARAIYFSEQFMMRA